MSHDAICHWNYPTAVSIGAGAIRELPSFCLNHGFKRPLLVTDPGLVNLPMVQDLVEDLKANGIPTTLFSNLKHNPTEQNVADGVEALHASQCDSVIAFGGGSALDAGKAIALMKEQVGSLWDFEDVGDNWKSVNIQGIAPCIAIPTTAGTGSEVGRASVITDTSAGIKKIIFHPKMMPIQVILDPELCVSLPPALTAATGMDALSHALEAFCAQGYHPMADGIAMQAMQLIKNHLPTAYGQPANLEARKHMLVASLMGATAFQKGLGAMHALAHPLGAMYDAHHGRLNAILMPYVLQANRTAIEAKMQHLATFLEIPDGFDGFIRWILDLRKTLEIEPRLLDIGIDDEQVTKLSLMATEDAASQGNPILLSENDYHRVLTNAIMGRL